jgi:dihydrolipoamide dehydrogenase
MGRAEGFVKIVADAGSGAVLGVHIAGAGAGDLIAEGTLALEMGAMLEDLAGTIHAHPTMPEALMEAAEDALGKAIHLYRGKKG